MVNDRLAGEGTSTTCHCEEAVRRGNPFLLGNGTNWDMLQGERIATPACALVRNDSGSRYLGGTIVRSYSAPAVEGPKGCASTTQSA